MTYQATVSSDGMVPLPEDLVRALGIRAGDKLSIDRSGSRIVLTRDDGRDAAAGRLRSAMAGYSVERFIAERQADAVE